MTSVKNPKKIDLDKEDIVIKIFDLYFLSDKAPAFNLIEKELGLSKGSVTDKVIKDIKVKRTEEYKEIKRIRDLWSNKKVFGTLKEFYEWYTNESICYYCETPQSIVSQIVRQGLLKSERFPKNGVVSAGRARGLFLEVDRKDPTKGYTRNNCVACCYFCNNDKSDIFNAVEYKKFFENRSKYLINLIPK